MLKLLVSVIYGLLAGFVTWYNLIEIPVLAPFAGRLGFIVGFVVYLIIFGATIKD